MTIARMHGPTVFFLLLLILATSVKSIPLTAPQSSDTKSKVELGRALFFDKRLRKTER